MSLDIVIFGGDGSPERTVGLGLREHWALVSAAMPPNAFPLLQRMRDYYADCTFGVAELPDLVEELRRIPRADNVAVAIDALLELCAVATSRECPVKVLAD